MNSFRQLRYSGLIIALICATAIWTALSVQEDDAAVRDNPVDPAVYAQHMLYRLDRLEDILPIFREHQEQFRVMTPIGFQLFQPFRPDPVPVSFDSLPKSFVNGLVGEHRMATIVYPIIIMEDPDTRYIHIFNAEDQHIYSLPPEPDYDRTPHLTAMPWLARATAKEQEYWKIFYDPSRVAMTMTLIAESDMELYLYARGRVDEEARLLQMALEDDEEGGFMMLMGGQFAISASLEEEALHVEWLGDADQYYRVQFSTSLMDPDWTFIYVVLGVNDLMSWVGDLSSGADRGFIRVEQRSISNPADTSGDGVDDVWKLLHGLDPLSATDVLEDGNGNGLTWKDEYQMGTDPGNPQEGAAALADARQRIILHWNLIYPTPLVFTNAPGSTADLQDLRNALMALSGHFYSPEAAE